MPNQSSAALAKAGAYSLVPRVTIELIEEHAQILME